MLQMRIEKYQDIFDDTGSPAAATFPRRQDETVCNISRVIYEPVRRCLSILLALIFGLGPLSAALPGAEDVNLPPCCRRNGAHHCAMAAHMAAMMAAAEHDGRTYVGAPSTCPYYPGPTLALLMPAAHALAAEAESLRVFATTTVAAETAQAAYLSSPSRTHSGRGPPLLLPG